MRLHQPFSERESTVFLWHNSTRCHSFTHLSKKWDGKTGFGLFADAMAELDWIVGELLAKVDELGIVDNTIVMFTSDNGAEVFSWPDGGNHPFRGEKGTVYEGGFRVPMLVKWPGVIKPGSIINEIMSAEDWMPTLVAAAGEPDLKEKVLTGYKAGGKTFKNHLDGYNFKPFFEGTVAESPRREFFYFSDNADLMAVRYNEWKITFKTIVGNLFSGKEDSTNVPLVTNLRVDPWERYQTESTSYGEWWGKKLWVMMPATMIMGHFLSTFKEFRPARSPARSAWRRHCRHCRRAEGRTENGPGTLRSRPTGSCLWHQWCFFNRYLSPKYCHS